MGKDKVDVGDKAPNFTRTAQDGSSLTLSALLQSKAVVLFFYPADFSPICTKEACAFRDSYQDFQDAGAEVVGVSSDGTKSHEKFAKDNNLPFRLISDKDGSLRDLYSVPSAMMLFPGRTTYVIDRSGVVRHVFTANLKARKHVKEALKTVASLKA